MRRRAQCVCVMVELNRSSTCWLTLLSAPLSPGFFPIIDATCLSSLPSAFLAALCSVAQLTTPTHRCRHGVMLRALCE